MKQNVIIVDNFYENPYEVRQYALSLDYPEPQEGYTYPGRNSNGTFYTQETHDKFELLLGRKLIPAQEGNHGDFRLSLETDTFQQDIHVDPIWDWGCVLYMNLPNQCIPEAGTSFWRHKKLGWERCPGQHEAAWYGYTQYEEIRSSIVYGDGLDRSKWDRYCLANMQYNRAVIFDPKLWHSHGENFGDNLENGRLVQLFFFSNG